MYVKNKRALYARVKSRDKYNCQMCGLPEKEILPTERAHVVHHIDGNKINNEYSNLITLCQHCHRYLHKGRGNPLSAQKFLEKKH